MYLVFIYYAYVYTVLHFILNKSINQSKVIIDMFTLPTMFSKTIKANLKYISLVDSDISRVSLL